MADDVQVGCGTKAAGWCICDAGHCARQLITAARAADGTASAREQIAEVLRAATVVIVGYRPVSPSMADGPLSKGAVHFLTKAVLAAPAVAEALAAVERVRALAEELGKPVDFEVSHYRDGLRDAAKQIRRALDGDRG